MSGASTQPVSEAEVMLSIELVLTPLGHSEIMTCASTYRSTLSLVLAMLTDWEYIAVYLFFIERERKMV